MHQLPEGRGQPADRAVPVVLLLEVKGIDRDGKPRSMPIEACPVRELVQDLCRADWKFAVVLDCGEVIGGVRLDSRLFRRVWWLAAYQP